MVKCESVPSCLKINMTWIWITIAVLCPNIFRIGSIQTRIHRPIRFIDERTFTTRHFRNIIDASVPLDWERGLREATVQALFREHFRDVNLKTHIYSAPILGKQDKATPFGDIAVLARGQLYANYAGFIFVQDPYQNDCDDCHNIDAADNTKERCIINHCQIWHPKNNEKIMALWKIRRIRHRSRQGGPKYEVEFTISPVGLRYQSDRYLTKEGTFNYNLPGHVFVLKSSESRQHVEEEQVANHFKQGAFIAQTLDGRKYTLHGFHGLTPQTPRYYELLPKYPEFSRSTSSTTQYAEEDEKNVYQALLNELHKKTSPESTRFMPTSKTSTTLSDKTLVQFTDGQMVPITELETPFITKTTPGYVTVRFPESNVIPATSGKQKSSPTKVTTPTLSNKVIPQSYGIMRPQTTPLTHRTIASNVASIQPLTTRGPHTNVAQSHTTVNELPQTPGIVYTKPIPFYTTASTKNNNISHPFGTTQSMIPKATKAPVKMTFHFFAAEEAPKPTPETFKIPLTTTTLHYTSTEYENLPYTLVPTKPTIMVSSEAPFTKAETTIFKKPDSYSTIDSTKKYFTTKIPSTNRPATVVKVTKPIVDDTTIYSSTFPSTTQRITKSIPSIALESSTSYFKVPITESSTKPSLEHKRTFSTTPFKEDLTVARTPKTTYTLQVYNPTAAMSQVTNIGQEMKSKESATLESTTYFKIPTPTPEKGPIQTTLGITTIMGTSQNKTTEMVYYAAEETEMPALETTQIAPTTFAQSTGGFIATTEPTYSIVETKTTNPTTPKLVVTTIEPEKDTIFVKTSPISADEELFGITKSFAKKRKLTKRPKIRTTSGPSDFLVDGGSSPDYAVPLFKKPSKDYSEDDIFGSTKGTIKKTSKNVVKHYTKSDLEQALFDTNNRKSKSLLRRRYSTTEVPLNVNYSNLFEASTSPTTTQTRDTSIAIGIVNAPVTKETTAVPRETGKDLRNYFSSTNKIKANGVTTESIPIATTMLNYETLPLDDRKHSKPVTSQSYLTSISYEVNKRARPSDGKSKEIIPRLRIDTKEENDDDVTYVAKETRHSTEPKMPETTPKNDFALRLVGHAKAVEYLEQTASTGAGTLEIINVKTMTIKPKYTRRRSYTPKSKRPTRKKVVKSKEIQI